MPAITIGNLAVIDERGISTSCCPGVRPASRALPAATSTGTGSPMPRGSASGKRPSSSVTCASRSERKRSAAGPTVRSTASGNRPSPPRTVASESTPVAPLRVCPAIASPSAAATAWSSAACASR